MRLERFPARLTRNPSLDRARPYGPAERAILSETGLAAAKAEIASWPGYAPTPLPPLPGLAKALGLGAALYKDEGARFELMSFKALGGAYAVLRVLQARAEAAGLGRPSAAEFASGRPAKIARATTVACATDGNHGRSVAWGARMTGCRCVIYLHEGVSEGREREIARFGAEIRRMPGDYDASVRACARDAEAEGWTLVADTDSGGGGPEIPRLVMQGYALIVDEVEAVDATPPSHVFVPGAVGGLAAAIVSAYWERRGADRPIIICVEPEQADCISRSLAARRPTAVEGEVDSFMACLAAGEVSPAAWPILEAGLDAALAIPDSAAMEAMRLLADGVAGDPPIVSGESGAAATAALIAAAQDPDVKAALGLGPDSRVLMIGSEGATDPETYTRTVGRPASAVAAA